MPALAERVADLLEPAEVEHLAGRAAGDHRDRGDLARPGRRSTSEASWWMCAALGVVDDRRQRAVEVEADDGPARGAHQVGVPLLALGGGELHGSTQPSRAAGAGRRAAKCGERLSRAGR